ncbi:uncharacterized protein [Montipora capricornis]|uniref:uncharacterized protein n=1 Tax=Montipora capricornis TaxID=246305 RepID=UPI0035F1C7E5
MFEQERKTQYLQTRRWSVVPNESSRDFGSCDRFWTQLALRCFLLPTLPPGYVSESQNIYSCANGMFEQERKTQYLQTRHWSVVPNESSRDFGPCDRFWTQLALRCFLLPTLPPGFLTQSQKIYACADGMFEQERKTQYLQTRRWSVVPNESSRDFGPCDRFWTQLALRCFLLPTLPPGYVSESQKIYACADGMFEQERKTQYLQTRRWSVVPNESSRDFGPCDRFWTQLALRCFLLPTLPPGYVSESQKIYACADGMFEQERKTQYLQTRRWSVVPNESSRDFGPCDRFWTQLALRCFLLPTLPPGYVSESQKIYACADGMFEQERKTQYLQTRRWSVVPNESSRDFGPCDYFWTQLAFRCFLLPTLPPGYVSESQKIYACADGMFEQERKTQYLQTRRWSVVPNESSRDFGPCDRFWTQLALRCFLLPTLPPGTALRERYVGP